MTTKTIAQMIAEFPQKPDMTPSHRAIGDEFDRIHIPRWQYRIMKAEVELLRAALENRQGSHGWWCWTKCDDPCTCGYDEANKVLEVTRG